MPFCEVKMSFVFSTDKDEPLFNLLDAEDENEKDKIKGRRSVINGIAMSFVKGNTSLQIGR